MCTQVPELSQHTRGQESSWLSSTSGDRGSDIVARTNEIASPLLQQQDSTQPLKVKKSFGKRILRALLYFLTCLGITACCVCMVAGAADAGSGGDVNPCLWVGNCVPYDAPHTRRDRSPVEE